MPLNATLYIAIGSGVALALGALLIWAVRRSSYQAGFAVAEKVHADAVLQAQYEGDTIVAMRRDPHDVSISLSEGGF